MPIDPPTLDQRTYNTLRSEALVRAVRYTPEWTDQNASDPGVTLLELFAWYTELLFYELNRVPDRNYVKFLQLLGIELTPPIPAVADVTFTVGKGASVGAVPQGTQVTAQNPADGSTLIFETEIDLDLVSLQLTDVQVFDGVQYAPYTTANQTPGTTYPVFGWHAGPGAALMLGFSPPQGSPPPSTAFGAQIRLRVFAPEGTAPGPVQAGPEAGRPPVAPAALVWEYRPVAEPDRWQRLAVQSDETAGFTRDGYVVLTGPPDATATEEQGGHVRDARYWLRCRIADTSGYASAPVVDVIACNTVPATNLATVRAEYLGQSGGQPGETFSLRHTPVDVTSLVLDVVTPDGDTRAWTAVDDFLSSQPNDPVYTVDGASGTITFGDGRAGRILPEGATITATVYRYGGGTAGNVETGAIATLASYISGVTGVTNPRPAVGGADEQTVEELGSLAPAILRAGQRTVTGADFVSEATRVGDVAKATAVPLSHPDHPGIEVPGTVSVVIVPANNSAPDPTPSEDLLRAVAADLDQHRLVSTEVFVVPASYQAIAVSATVVAAAGHSPDAITQAAEAAINAYLDPLAGGMDGQGWPFGQSLIPTNLYAVLAAVAGVAGVTSLTVAVDGRDHPVDAAIAVPPDGLLYGAGHTMTVLAVAS
jgi:predicted phage baseplate assembly protein